ncbi:M50 family metallopeptidase [Paenibacillus sp. J5C2022]|uniref:M50 family metallopeptidase n=1 Tax=Paenibacillus sp. J5C2022 TaxID=2977129 RepID=UPI003978D359
MFGWLRTGLMLAAVLILTRFIPFSSFFRNVNTLVHELSHAVAALVLRGSVMQIHLYPDQSGVTYTVFETGWRVIPIAAAGYAGASLFAVWLFALYARGSVKSGLAIIAVTAAAALALFIRNDYGMLWSAGFVLLTGIVLLLPGWVQKGYYLLIAFLCLVEALVTPFILLYLSVVTPTEAGDAASLSQATAVPAFIWSLLFVLFSLWCARIALNRLFVPRPSRAEQH